MVLLAPMIPILAAAVELLMNGAISGNNQNRKYDELVAKKQIVQQQIKDYEALHAKQSEEIAKISVELKNKQITTFEDIEKHDKQAKEVLVRLANETKPFALKGNNIGLFGITSTGKSTMLNALYGKKVAEIGIGETTVNITSYPTESFTLWDVPGKNDEISYLSMHYISFFKGLTKRLILVCNTLKENSSMMKLLDAIGLDYEVVVNVKNECEEGELSAFRKQIDGEAGTLQLKGVNKTFFVNAKHPKRLPAWVNMVDYLTGGQEKSALYGF